MGIYRQGDVLVRRVTDVPVTAKPVDLDNGCVILAYGEATGHAHAIHSRAKMFRDDAMATWLQVDTDGADLVHEEHATIYLPAGNYQVVIQREYSPQAIRNVAD